MVDRVSFFAHVRHRLFDRRMTRAQVAGIEAILDRAGKRPGGLDDRWLAYILATVHHETGRRMQPVRETGASSDAQAITRLDAAFRKGTLPSVRVPYWRPDEDGKSWLGRGLVQITHRRNYETLSRLTGIDLVTDPARTMEPDIAIAILFTGMETGAFTGKALADYFHASSTDWTGARRIINGRDRAAEIAALGRSYRAALNAAPPPTGERISPIEKRTTQS